MDNIITVHSKNIGHLVDVKFSKKETKIISKYHIFSQTIKKSIKTFILILLI